jgi:TM2 domain-containing membrane protein YozV
MYAPIPLKNAGIAAVLAFLWAGLGHIYLGQIGKGIMFMLVYIILWVIGFLTFFGLILPFIFWIWQLYDAYTKANEYNASVQQTGRAPW